MPRTVSESQENSSVAGANAPDYSGGWGGAKAKTIPGSRGSEAGAAGTMEHGGAALTDRDLGVADGSGVLAMNAMGEGTAFRRVRTMNGAKPAQGSGPDLQSAPLEFHSTDSARGRFVLSG